MKKSFPGISPASPPTSEQRDGHPLAWAAAGAIGIFSAGFFMLTGHLMKAWLGGSHARGIPRQPATIFRPIKSGERGLRRTLEGFLSAVEDGDQVLFGVSGAGELSLCKELADAHPGLDIACLLAAEGIHQNPKINKLAQMEMLASHQRWIVLDSDAVTGTDFLRAFRGEWEAGGWDAFSAPYHFGALRRLPSRLDAAGTALGLWPGVALLRTAGRVNFLAGACMGVTAGAIRALGGWKILGDSLADDHDLGAAIHRAGGTVGMATCHLPLATHEMGWLDWALHQHRAHATFHLCNPAGTLGLPLTHGIAISFFFALLRARSPVRWALHAALFLLRLQSSRALPGPPPRPADVWLASLCEPFFWAIALLPLPVRWAGAWIKPKKLSAQSRTIRPERQKFPLQKGENLPIFATRGCWDGKSGA